jgi:hypothetical protein
MSSQVTFLGPIVAYARKDGGEWEAWVDPFSVVGCGRTADEAIECAKRNVVTHITDLSAAMDRHGSRKVALLCPLTAAHKRGAKRTERFLLYAVRKSRAPGRASTKPSKLTRDRIRNLFRDKAEVGLVPAAVAAL